MTASIGFVCFLWVIMILYSYTESDDELWSVYDVKFIFKQKGWNLDSCNIIDVPYWSANLIDDISEIKYALLLQNSFLNRVQQIYTCQIENEMLFLCSHWNGADGHRNVVFRLKWQNPFA